MMDFHVLALHRGLTVDILAVVAPASQGIPPLGKVV